MRLHWSPKSPFVRKVMIAAHELNLTDRIELMRNMVALTKPNPVIMADNPLNKIPTLVLADGTVLTDSRVIIEYLDALAGGDRLLPVTGPERWVSLARQAQGDGLLDLLIIWRNEREKPVAQVSHAWIDAFEIKAQATLDRFETSAPALAASRFDVGQIAIGCALSYLDFRFDAVGWRRGRPALEAWHDGFTARASVRATEVTDD